MKYIVFETIPEGDELKRTIPVVFPKEMVHSIVSNVIVLMYHHSHKTRIKPVGAGEYCLFKRTCSGGSSTLDLESRGQLDEAAITMNDLFGGFV